MPGRESQSPGGEPVHSQGVLRLPLADSLPLEDDRHTSVEFRDYRVDLEAGEFCVVPHGVEHRTMAKEEAEVLIFEPAATRNTGNVEDENFTASNEVAV